jgi:3-oxoacyl-[acyl-carrier protein] reductase
MSETVLVTGSSRGIGRAIAITLARDGFNVVLHCRARRDEAIEVQQIVESMGRSCRILQFDVRDREMAAETLLADVEATRLLLRRGVPTRASRATTPFRPCRPTTGTRCCAPISTASTTCCTRSRCRWCGARSAGTHRHAGSSVSGVHGQPRPGELQRGQGRHHWRHQGAGGGAGQPRQITVNCVAPGLIATEMVAPELPSRSGSSRLIPAQARRRRPRRWRRW